MLHNVLRTIALFTLPLAASVMDTSKQAQAEPRPPVGFVVEAKVQEGSIILGDPIVLTTTAQNASQQPISIVCPQRLPHFERKIRIDTLAPGEKKFKLVDESGPEDQGFTSPPRHDILTLAPGEKRSFDFVLDFGSRLYDAPDLLFPVADEYKIKIYLSVLPQPTKKETVPYETPMVTVSPLPVTVTVKNPPPQDAEAYTALRQLQNRSYLYAPYTFGYVLPPQAVEEIQAFQAQHPQSRYAKFAGLALLYNQFGQALIADNRNLMLTSLKQIKGFADQKNLPFGWKVKADRFYTELSQVRQPR